VSDFRIDVFWSEDDGCYVADIPDLFPCAAFGESPEAAIAEVQVAKAAWLESARELGFIPPEPA
jgi:predicted RNase H-like HicB family nuclease